MLDKQIAIYGIDTGDFYSNKEAHLHWKIHQIRAEKRFLKNKINMISADIVKQLEQVKSYYNELLNNA